MQPYAMRYACRVPYALLCRLPLAGDRLTNVRTTTEVCIKVFNYSTCAEYTGLIGLRDVLWSK